MDARYLQATTVLPRQNKVCGRTLLPFCLRHRVALEAIESPFIDPQNRPHKQAVSVGIRNAGTAQITDGLESGQRVVTTGAFDLGKLDADVLDKTKVQIQPPKKDEDEDDAP